MRTLRRWLPRVLSWPAVLGWMALIFAGSSVPADIIAAPPPRVPIDKVAHVGEYAVLAFLLASTGRGRMHERRITPLLLAGCIALATVYGAGDEFHQRFVPGRDAARSDLAADAAGATAGALAATMLLPWLDPPPATRGGSASRRRAP